MNKKFVKYTTIVFGLLLLALGLYLLKSFADPH